MIHLIYISSAASWPSETDLIQFLEQSRARNIGVLKIHESEIEQRDFPDWGMGFKYLESISPDELPGFIGIFNKPVNKNIVTNNKIKVIDML